MSLNKSNAIRATAALVLLGSLAIGIHLLRGPDRDLSSHANRQKVAPQENERSESKGKSTSKTNSDRLRSDNSDAYAWLASEDIQSRGDYALAIRLTGGLERQSAGQLLTWIFKSKSPMGWKFDLSEKQKVIGILSNGKPSDFLKNNFLREFGTVHGADVAANKEPIPLSGRDFLSYINGVCQISREAVFQNIESVQDEATKRIACEISTPILLNADAIGFSQFLGSMAPSETKDMAILQMIKWLVKKDSKSDSQPWLNAIGSQSCEAGATSFL